MRKIARIVFGRMLYVILALLLQFIWLFAFFVFLDRTSTGVSIAMRALSILIVLWIINRKINPSYKLAWTVVILIFPIFGLVVYTFFGNSRVARVVKKNYEWELMGSARFSEERIETRQQLESIDQDAANQSRYIRDHSVSPVCANTTATYYSVGEELFQNWIEELEKAKHYIFMEYYIINDGVMWKKILDILIRKAQEGVDVRLLYDDFGCLITLPHDFYKELQAKKIKCAKFNPIRPFLNVFLNNRDHRKICVIDGHTGFTGGINIADEYINQKERFGHWKDTGVMLKGDAVWNLTIMFLQMWSVITRVPSSYNKYLPHQFHAEPFRSDGFIQPFSDSPLDNEAVGENVYLNIINKAKKYVYICTPYLIIDNEVMTALCLAAKSGIDVRLMTPGIPDKKMIFWLTQSYYEQLIEAGVKIYEYQLGFLHAKSFVSDDEYVVIGTINLDYRSLYLHFENGVWLYRNSIWKDVKADFLATIEKSKMVTLEFCKNRNIFVRWTQTVLKVFAPLL
ncbi:MAG: cardiolipin synthase [Lachnospiraceae bacterium]